MKDKFIMKSGWVEGGSRRYRLCGLRALLNVLESMPVGKAPDCGKKSSKQQEKVCHE